MKITVSCWFVAQFRAAFSRQDHVIMAPADSSTGFWERPPRPVKVGVNDPPIPPKADPKAKAGDFLCRSPFFGYKKSTRNTSEVEFFVAFLKDL